MRRDKHIVSKDIRKKTTAHEFYAGEGDSGKRSEDIVSFGGIIERA